MYFNSNFMFVPSLVAKYMLSIYTALVTIVDWQEVIIGSGDELVPNRSQAITWTNDYTGCSHICASPSLNQ